MAAPTEEKAAPASDTTSAAEPSTLPAPRVAAAVPLRMGLAPTSIEEGWRLATMFAKSGLVPKNFQGKPEDVLVAIELGVEIGLPPMQALQSIAVINGRPSLWGDGFLALIMASPLYTDHDEYFTVEGDRRDVLTVEDLKKDTTTAICTFWRRGKAMPVTRSFSVGQAKKASLLGKEGPWQSYPDRMLRMRARSWAGRDAFPDLLRGIRTAEEAVDIPDDDFIETARVEPLQPRRASAAPSSPAAPSPSEPVAEDAPTPVPVPGLQSRGRITGTKFVRPKQAGIEPYYEVELKGDGVEGLFVTRDERLFKEAVSFEGTDHMVVLYWRTARLVEKGEAVHFIEQLAIAEQLF